MVGHGGSSAGSYLADPTSPIPSHCASIVVTSTVRVKKWQAGVCCRRWATQWESTFATYWIRLWDFSALCFHWYNLLRKIMRFTICSNVGKCLWFTQLSLVSYCVINGVCYFAYQFCYYKLIHTLVSCIVLLCNVVYYFSYQFCYCKLKGLFPII